MAWFLSHSRPFTAQHAAGKAATEVGLRAHKGARRRLTETQESRRPPGQHQAPQGRQPRAWLLPRRPTNGASPEHPPRALGSAHTAAPWEGSSRRSHLRQNPPEFFLRSQLRAVPAREPSAARRAKASILLDTTGCQRQQQDDFSFQLLPPARSAWGAPTQPAWIRQLLRGSPAPQ